MNNNYINKDIDDEWNGKDIQQQYLNGLSRAEKFEKNKNSMYLIGVRKIIEDDFYGQDYIHSDNNKGYEKLDDIGFDSEGENFKEF